MSEPAFGDPESQFEFLLEHDVVREDDDGTVVATEAYDAVRGIYHDTYADCPESVFVESIAALFALSEEEAEERIEELGITRLELVAYLSLDSYLDDAAPDVELDQGVHLQLAGMLAGITPESAVPDAMPELTDEEYAAFLEEHGDAILFVWKLHCAPCDDMKRALGEILDAAPENVAVAGVDGGTVSEFRREFDVNAAPATMTFVDGELKECVTGRRTVGQLSEMFANAYGSSAALD